MEEQTKREKKEQGFQREQQGTVSKRLQQLLLAQVDRFQLCLDVLDKQRKRIEEGEAESIVSYVDLEEQILGELHAIQRVLIPLEFLYQSILTSPGEGKAPSWDREILEIKTLAEYLQREVKSQFEQNRELLSKKMALLRRDLQVLRESPLGNRISVYANPGTPSFIDLEL